MIPAPLVNLLSSAIFDNDQSPWSSSRAYRISSKASLISLTHLRRNRGTVQLVAASRRKFLPGTTSTPIRMNTFTETYTRLDRHRDQCKSNEASRQEVQVYWAAAPRHGMLLSTQRGPHWSAGRFQTAEGRQPNHSPIQLPEALLDQSLRVLPTPWRNCRCVYISSLVACVSQ
jgi:hypothetical protein